MMTVYSSSLNFIWFLCCLFLSTNTFTLFQQVGFKIFWILKQDPIFYDLCTFSLYLYVFILLYIPIMYMKYVKSIKAETAFTKTEMNYESNIHSH